jgi:Flp pilus assembly protein TadD
MSRLSQSRRLTPPSRSRSTLLFLVGNLVFVMLLGGGVGYSFQTRGRLPDVRFGYVDNHRQLLETGKRSELIPDLRTAALIDFNDASAQLQLLSTASMLNDSKNVAVAMRGLLSHTPDDAELHAELAAVLLRRAALDEALVHSRYAVKLVPSSARLHSIHGAVMLAMGRNHEAGNAYREALRLDPRSEPAKRALTYPLRNY